MPKSHPLMLMSTKPCSGKCCWTCSSYCCWFVFSNIFPQTGQSSTWARCCSTWLSRSVPPAGKAASHQGQWTFSSSTSLSSSGFPSPCMLYGAGCLGCNSGTEAGATSGRRGGGREGVEVGWGNGWNRDGLWDEVERAAPILTLSMFPSEDREGRAKSGESMFRPVGPMELQRLTCRLREQSCNSW